MWILVIGNPSSVVKYLRLYCRCWASFRHCNHKDAAQRKYFLCWQIYSFCHSPQRRVQVPLHWAQPTHQSFEGELARINCNSNSTPKPNCSRRWLKCWHPALLVFHLPKLASNTVIQQRVKHRERKQQAAELYPHVTLNLPHGRGREGNLRQPFTSTPPRWPGSVMGFHNSSHA